MTIIQTSTPGPQGPALNLRGPWSSTVTYAIGDAASYNGSLYGALQPNSNVVPGTSPTQWTIVAQAAPMVGATGGVAGSPGMVPAPPADAQGRFLRGDGAWVPGAITGLAYNGSGQLTGYTEDGIAYTLTYNADGTLATITGGGSIGTLSYSAGVFTGISFT